MQEKMLPAGKIVVKDILLSWKVVKKMQGWKKI